MLLYYVNRVNYYYYQVYVISMVCFVNVLYMLYLIKPDIIISNKYNISNSRFYVEVSVLACVYDNDTHLERKWQETFS